MRHLKKSRALWNRSHLDLRSDEVLSQILDRGEIEAWQELYALAKADPALRKRILSVISNVHIDFPRFWLAAMVSLGEDVDMGVELPESIDPC